MSEENSVRLNSLYAWYPLIERVVPTPKTVLVPCEGEFESADAVCSVAYGGEVTVPEMKRLVEKADDAVRVLGGYPVFLRSDETSHKHDWGRSCFVSSRKGLARGMANIFEFTLCSMGLGFGGVVVREFLDLPHEFHAFNGMPVSREFRFFIKDGAVLCRHPYWFPSCIRRVDVEDWLPKLRKIQVLDADTQGLLDGYALRVSDAVKSLGAPSNYWSVDFCYATGRGWLVTDMALGEDSYHYSSCEFASEEMRRRYPDPEDLSGVTTVAGLRAERARLLKLLDGGEL